MHDVLSHESWDDFRKRTWAKYGTWLHEYTPNALLFLDDSYLRGARIGILLGCQSYRFADTVLPDLEKKLMEQWERLHSDLERRVVHR